MGSDVGGILLPVYLSGQQTQTPVTMSNTKHTPGPWYEYDMGWSGQTAIAVKHANSNFLIVPAMNKGANARLIAAAPELLAACQEIIEGVVDGKNSTNKNVTMYAIQMVKSAIAKATGTI